MNSLQQRLESGLAGRYVLERDLGQGGMAMVFLAQDLRHDRKVALKVLRPDISAAIGAERFLREIKLAARLHHPHILPVYDSGEADGLLFYVMPYMEGRVAAGAARPGAAAAAAKTRSRSRARSPTRWTTPTGTRGPPRHQAREHPAHERRGHGGGLRDRARHSAGRRVAHPDRDGRRHADLHEPGTGGRRHRPRRPQRSVQPRLRALRDAGGRAAVHRRRRRRPSSRSASSSPIPKVRVDPRCARGGGRCGDAERWPGPRPIDTRAPRSFSRRCVRLTTALASPGGPPLRRHRSHARSQGHRRSAAREYERRPRERVLQRRDDGRDHQCARQGAGHAGRVAHLLLRLQGKGGGHSRRSARSSA